MPSHQLDYEILGASAQSVEVILDPGETVIAEAGVMNYMTDGIRFETRLGDGAATGVLGKLWGMGKRMLTGWVRGEGDHFHQNRQAFLGHRGRGRALGQKGADRLA